VDKTDGLVEGQIGGGVSTVVVPNFGNKQGEGESSHSHTSKGGEGQYRAGGEEGLVREELFDVQGGDNSVKEKMNDATIEEQEAGGRSAYFSVTSKEDIGNFFTVALLLIRKWGRGGKPFGKMGRYTAVVQAHKKGRKIIVLKQD